jgi:hypothetical protein
MSSPDRSHEGFHDLEAELVALGASLPGSPPPPAEVARAVRARLEAEPARPESETVSGPARGFRLSPRRAAAAVAVVLAVLAGVTPQGRAAVTSVLRLAGIEIHIGEPGPLPTGLPHPLPGERRVTLEEARHAVRFPVVLPGALGEPADVRIADGGRVVTLLWPGDRQAVRLDEFDGTLGVVFRKELGEPWPEQVPAVNGWWISRPHAVWYLPLHGALREERVAGPTLIWQHGQVGMRMEGPDRATALRIALSVH